MFVCGWISVFVFMIVNSVVVFGIPFACVLYVYVVICLVGVFCCLCFETILFYGFAYYLWRGLLGD